MAKVQGIFQFRKKLGQAVGYNLKNSNSKETGAVRVYQPIVANPKTDAQSAQRIKLMPLQIFYQSFGDVLNHSFEGRKVGQMNRQRFMQLNMAGNAEVAPAVQKGERVLAPIKCQVSSGSLTIDTSLTPGANKSLVTSSLKCNSGIAGDLKALSVAEFSQNIIAANLGLEDGMEVAVMLIVSSERDVRAGVPLKFYIVLNSADNITTVEDCMGNVSNFIDFSSTDRGFLQISATDDEVTPFLGAAIIVSRKRNTGWSNNNARFYPTTFGEEIYYNESLYLAALATYGPTGSALSSELFLQQADNASGALNPNAVMGTEPSAIVLTGDYEGGVLSNSNALLATLRSGVKAIVVNRAGEIVDADGNVITVTVGTGDDAVTSNLTPAMTEFAGLKQVNYASF